MTFDSQCVFLQPGYVQRESDSNEKFQRQASEVHVVDTRRQEREKK